jgi:hypothetical protein
MARKCGDKFTSEPSMIFCTGARLGLHYSRYVPGIVKHEPENV